MRGSTFLLKVCNRKRRALKLTSTLFVNPIEKFEPFPLQVIAIVLVNVSILERSHKSSHFLLAKLRGLGFDVLPALAGCDREDSGCGTHY